MEAGVTRLLADCGIHLRAGPRDYRPTLSIEGFETKVLKPQNIVEMLGAGSRDVGFAGADWAAELDADVVELLDTGLDPVRIVAAAPGRLLEQGQLPKRLLVVVSEYRRLTECWIAERELDASFLLSYGATEVFPPEDADVIVDNSASGKTLEANDLTVVDELLCSSTRLYANPAVLDDPDKRARIDDLVLLLRSVLDARSRVMFEVNVPADRLEAVIDVLPCMDQPTVAPLHGKSGFGVKAAVPRTEIPRLVPLVKSRGGTDIVVTQLSQIVP